jgi:NhaP-type Na+/H+ or K+/H+ antiporter
MGWPWDLSVLFGTLVIVTGPTVILPVLRNLPLRRRLSTVLEAESVLIDPIGAIVAALTVQVVVGASADCFAAGVLGLVLRFGFGAAAGIAFGLALGRLLRSHSLVPEGLEDVVTLGSVLLCFAACEAVLSESGILAVTMAGVAVGNVETRMGRELGKFEERLTVAALGVLFALLAADVRIADVTELGAAGLYTVGALMLVVRPVGVAACTVRTELEWRDRAFLAWMGPRGIVAAAVASSRPRTSRARGPGAVPCGRSSSSRSRSRWWCRAASHP